MSWMPPVSVPATVVEAIVHEKVLEDMITGYGLQVGL
jgi:hypothetical protein